MVTTGQIVVSRYEILGMLGKGGQGETWKARDLHQNEVVAIKFLTSQGLGPWHEASALTLLRDDHILPIRNADMASGVPYLATELAVDGTVLDKIQASGNAGIEPAVAVRWTRQACQAVARTHQASILHTDVKPENLFLDGHGKVRLGDYGLVSLIDQAGLGHTSGTAQTLAPEVAEAMVLGRARGTSVRSDVYSLGATLYWMLSALPPFQPVLGKGVAATAPEIARHVPARLWDLAPHLPQVLVQSVEKAMARDPGQRYATPGEFAAGLGALPSKGRSWVRTDEDAGHLGCWRGTAGRGAVVLVCAETSGTRVHVSAAKLPHRRAVRAAGGATTMAALPVLLRKTFKTCA